MKRSITTILKERTFAIAVAMALALASAEPLAATIMTVPMQGGMVMPMIGYHAEHGHLHVMLDPTVPQLTSLLVSNPGDTFDPADPWFEALDPSRQGRAFSRRYGFVMDADTDPLPDNTAIWIRKISGSPELKAYRYLGNAPKTWEPIFGTDGASDSLLWNGMMFHPAFTAPPGREPLSATFQVYLANTTTGEEVDGSGSGTFTLTWTNVADGRPKLDIASKVTIAWPASAANFVLQVADSLPASSWTTLTNTPVLLDGNLVTILDPTEAKRFFRLSPR